MTALVLDCGLVVPGVTMEPSIFLKEHAQDKAPYSPDVKMAKTMHHTSQMSRWHLPKFCGRSNFYKKGRRYSDGEVCSRENTSFSVIGG